MTEHTPPSLAEKCVALEARLAEVERERDAYKKDRDDLARAVLATQDARVQTT